MMATPVNEALMHKFRSAPDFLGDVSSVELLTEHGKRFARVGQELKEVVVANAHDVASWPGLTEGVCTSREACGGGACARWRMHLLALALPCGVLSPATCRRGRHR